MCFLPGTPPRMLFSACYVNLLETATRLMPWQLIRLTILAFWLNLERSPSFTVDRRRSSQSVLWAEHLQSCSVRLQLPEVHLLRRVIPTLGFELRIAGPGGSASASASGAASSGASAGSSAAGSATGTSAGRASGSSTSTATGASSSGVSTYGSRGFAIAVGMIGIGFAAMFVVA